MGHLPNVPLLHAACAQKSLEVVQFLVDAGASLKPEASGLLQAPLHVACAHSSLAVVQFLLSKGAALDVFDNDTHSPVDFAVMRKGGAGNENLEIVKLLVEKGSALRAPTIVRSAIGGEIAVVDYVCKQVKDEVSIPLLLKTAIGASSVDLIAHLIKAKGAVPTSEFCFLAVKPSVKVEVLQTLLTADPSLAQSKAQGGGGVSLMQSAVLESNWDALHYLLREHRDTASLQTTAGNDALRAACVTCRNEAALRAIIEATPDVNAGNRHSSTALHLAIVNLNLPAVRLLAQHPKINVMARTNTGQIALEIIEEKAQGQFQNGRNKLAGLVARTYDIASWTWMVVEVWAVGIPGAAERVSGRNGAGLLAIDPAKMPSELAKKLHALHDLAAIAGIIEPMTRKVFLDSKPPPAVQDNWGLTEVLLWLEAHGFQDSLVAASTYSVIGRDLLVMRTENMEKRLNLAREADKERLKALLGDARMPEAKVVQNVVVHSEESTKQEE